MNSNLNQTFFFRLWCESKALFIAICAFIIVQLYFTFLQRENFPFLHWGMYSGRHAHKENFTVYDIVIDHRPMSIGSLWDAQNQVVLGTLDIYDDLRANNFHDPLQEKLQQRLSGKISPEQLNGLMQKLTNDSIEAARYRLWLLHYLADMRMVSDAGITVKKHTVGYGNAGFIVDLKSDTLFTAHD